MSTARLHPGHMWCVRPRGGATACSHAARHMEGGPCWGVPRIGRVRFLSLTGRVGSPPDDFVRSAASMPGFEHHCGASVGLKWQAACAAGMHLHLEGRAVVSLRPKLRGCNCCHNVCWGKLDSWWDCRTWHALSMIMGPEARMLKLLLIQMLEGTNSGRAQKLQRQPGPAASEHLVSDENLMAHPPMGRGLLTLSVECMLSLHLRGAASCCLSSLPWMQHASNLPSVVLPDCTESRLSLWVPFTCRYGITVLCFEFFASSAMFIHGLTLLRRTVPRDPLTPPAPQSYHIRSAQLGATLGSHSKMLQRRPS